jgi:hypothetical protein
MLDAQWIKGKGLFNFNLLHQSGLILVLWLRNFISFLVFGFSQLDLNVWRYSDKLISIKGDNSLLKKIVSHALATIVSYEKAKPVPQREHFTCMINMCCLKFTSTFRN